MTRQPKESRHMPSRERVEAFVALVEQASYVEALEEFYHPTPPCRTTSGRRG